MSGEEFLNWLHGIKKIERVEWLISGDDCLNAEEIKISVIADGEQTVFFFGREKVVEYPDDMCRIAIGLIANLVMKQVGLCDDLGPFTMYDDPCMMVNETRKNLEAGDSQ